MEAMKIVLANGVFDILHIGHIEHLRQARNMGTYLIVSLTEDDCVNKGPGRPFNTWEQRARMLSELRSVNMVIRTKTAVGAIWEVRPHIFVKGIDYASGDKFTEDIEGACRAVGAKLRYTDSSKHSADQIIRKVLA